MTNTRRRRTSETPGIRRTTIRDVAEAAGVSISTVSNALNGRVEAMGEATYERIQATIKQLHYRPNGVARGLVNRRTTTIGLLLAEIETPLFIQSLNVIEPIARTVGYNVLVCSARNQDDELQALNLFLEKEVEGFLFLSTSVYVNDDIISRVVQSGRAAAFINRTVHDHSFDQVDWDNAQGVAAAVAHLAELGHQRIAHLHGPQNRRSSTERLEGYRRGLEQAGLAYRPEYVRSGDFTADQALWEHSTHALLALSVPPTAIIAADDVVAAVVMKTVQRAGIRIPHDIAIVGIDDQPFAAYLNPSLTTVQLPVLQASQRAVEMLLDRIAGRRTGSEQVMLPCPLVVRESCGTRRSDSAGGDA
jgi:LacI family transcriptional regulator